MKRFAITLLSFLAACGGTPVSYLVSAPQPEDASYACALRRINELGYNITNVNKEARFITADKQTTGKAFKLWTGAEFHDQLTVSIFGDSASGGRKMRVTAASVSRQSNLFGTSTEGKPPSDEGKRNANDLLIACGSGPVSKQGSGGEAAAQQ